MLMFSIGAILRDKGSGQRYRVIGMVKGVATLCEMDTKSLKLTFVSQEKVMYLLACEEFAVETEERSVIDYDSLPDYAKLLFEQKRNVVQEIHKAYGPGFEKLSGKRYKPEAMAIMEKYGMNRMTFWKTIRLYLQSGFDMNVLVDNRLFIEHRGNYEYTVKTGKPCQYIQAGVLITNEIKKYFEDALAYYKSGRAKSFMKAFDYMNSLHYTEVAIVNGRQVCQLISPDHRPTFNQFYGYCRKHLTKEEQDAIKTSRAEQRNNKSILLGESIDGINGPGSMVEVDACEVDCSIVSSLDRSKTIGRPVVYFMIDVYSRMIVAASVGFDNNSFLGFTNLMLNLSDDKHAYCERFGISFTDDRLWQSGFIPDAMRVDRGSEFKSKAVERICGELSIERQLVTGATGSLKGVVEQSFHQLHCQLNTHLEGKGLIEKRYDSNHHAEATLTIEEYTKLVINFVLAHNQTPLETYRLTKDMKENRVNPIPAELWQYGVRRFGQPRPIGNLSQYCYELMMPVTAKYSREGICYKNLYYGPDNDSSMMAKFFNAGNKKISIEMRIDPRDISRMYYMSGSELKSCHLLEKGDSISYAGMTLKQYEDYDLSKHCVVKAEYVRSDNPMFQGNPYIEALPSALSSAELQRVYNRRIYGYDINAVAGMSESERLSAIEDLRNLRFSLPFHADIEREFRKVLVLSYKSRYRLDDKMAKIDMTIQSRECKVGTILCGNPASSTDSGFGIVGYSGCGKSSAVEILTSHYPQVIMHGKGMNKFPQIVYLVVGCPPNSNFSALYDSIGDAIDKALGNISPIYFNEVRRVKGLGNKANVVQRLVELFGIGCLILDEIQLIDFDSTKENSFESLMILSNKTKLAICAVGTEDALGKMFGKLRTARRIGRVIPAYAYCENKLFFSFLLKQLLCYQWFSRIVEYSDELCNALYDVTKGIIDQLIAIYYCMHIEHYVDTSVPIDDCFVRNVAKDYFPNIQELLACIGSENFNELANSKASAAVKAKLMLEKLKAEKNAEEIMSKPAEADSQLDRVVTAVAAVYDFPVSTIETAYKTVKKKGKTEKEIIQAVIGKAKSVMNRQKKEPYFRTADEMISFLGDEDADT